jgi:hypothetical protein
VVGDAPRPFVNTTVGVTTLSNKYKSEATAYNKADLDTLPPLTEMEMEKVAQAAELCERLRCIRLIKDTFASGQFKRFDVAASKIRSALSIASKKDDEKKDDEKKLTFGVPLAARVIASGW